MRVGASSDIWFSSSPDAVRVSGASVHATHFVSGGALLLGGGAGEDIVSAVAAKQALPVIDGAVGPENLAASVITASKFSGSAQPVPVSRGGLGVGVLVEGAVLVGRGEDPVSWAGYLTGSAAPTVTVTESGLKTKSVVFSNGARLAARANEFGDTLVATLPSGAAVNLMSPTSSPPSGVALSAAAVAGGTRVTAEWVSGYPVSLFVTWAPAACNYAVSPESLTIPPGGEGVGWSGNVRFRGTAEYEIAASSAEAGVLYDVHAVLVDARANVSAPASVQATVGA